MSIGLAQESSGVVEGVTRWWVGVQGIDPSLTRIEHLHAAVTTWLDQSDEHRDRVKPHALSPLAADHELGFEIGLLTDESRRRLQAALADGAPLRLGQQYGHASQPRLLSSETWGSLSSYSGATRWHLDLVTPTTFRRHDRTTPLPAPDSILRGLTEVWNAFAPAALRCAGRPMHDEVWIEQIDGASTPLRLAMGKTRGRPLTISGFVGNLTVRCDAAAVAPQVDRLLRLAPYCGIGSFKHRGLGVTRLGSITAPSPRQPTADDHVARSNTTGVVGGSLAEA